MIRSGGPGDAPACAEILNDWIDATDWMPRIHARGEVGAYYRDIVLPRQLVWVAGEPVEGFVALVPEKGMISALYVAAKARGRGVGQALLEQARAGKDAVHLWTFAANIGAQAFYRRHGFRQTAKTTGDNEEQLPDLRFDWAAA